jgi:hypothetical protein
MQRAAASTPLPASPSPSTPSRPSPYNIPSTDSPSSKRLKTTHTPSPSSASPLAGTSDAAAARAALAAEQAQRETALEKLNVESGETRWAFSYFDTAGGGTTKGNPQDGNGRGALKVVGYGEEEEEGEEEYSATRQRPQPWREESGQGVAGGRMKFGTWKRAEVSFARGACPYLLTLHLHLRRAYSTL